MINVKKHALSFFVLCVLFFMFAGLPLIQNSPTAQAASNNLWNSQEGMSDVGSKAFGSSDTPTDIRVITANIIKVFLALLGIIFVVLLVLAGYKWMTAMGNEDKVSEAKGQITTAIIGLLIILAAYAITKFVTECALRATGGSSDTWYCGGMISW